MLWFGLNVKEGVTTVSEMLVVATIVPDVPVTVTGYVPVGIELIVENVT